METLIKPDDRWYASVKIGRTGKYIWLDKGEKKDAMAVMVTMNHFAPGEKAVYGFWLWTVVDFSRAAGWASMSSCDGSEADGLDVSSSEKIGISFSVSLVLTARSPSFMVETGGISLSA